MQIACKYVHGPWTNPHVTAAPSALLRLRQPPGSLTKLPDHLTRESQALVPSPISQHFPLHQLLLASSNLAAT